MDMKQKQSNTVVEKLYGFNHDKSIHFDWLMTFELLSVLNHSAKSKTISLKCDEK